MKPKTILSGRFALAILAITATFALVSWDVRQSGGRYKPDQNDTVPNKAREKKIRDLDDVLDELNSHDFKLEMEKWQRELADAMKELNFDKIKLDFDLAMKDINFDKIKLDFDLAMKDVDFDKIKLDFDKAMKDIDFDKIKLDFDKVKVDFDFGKLGDEIRESMAKIDWDDMKKEMDQFKKEDWDKLKKELDHIKDVDLEKLKIELKDVGEEMKKIKPDLEKELYKVKEEMEKVKIEMAEYKELVDGLEKEGLLNKKEPYTIKHKDGELTVNGKKVPAAVYEKYRKILEKHKKFNIEKSADDFNIDID